MDSHTTDPVQQQAGSNSPTSEAVKGHHEPVVAGPRTPLGKERSKFNATAHGIFSNAVVLKNESPEEYGELLTGLRETLQPEGTVENILVEKLATIIWRHRRILVAEGAEIQKETQFLEWDKQNQERGEAEKIGTRIVSSTPDLDAIFPTSEPGLISNIHNSEILSWCIELLTMLRPIFDREGFSSAQCQSILTKVYGSNTVHLHQTLKDKYSSWSKTPAQKEAMLNQIDYEIDNLKTQQETSRSIESDRNKLEGLRRSVPDSPKLDRLLRYETSLERNFDRTMSQLERLQRMRLGQSVAPRIDVNLST